MLQPSTDLFRVTLLGTGAPPPVLNRFGPSTLVEVGNQKFLFDAGRGALQRLFQLNIPRDVFDTSSLGPSCRVYRFVADRLDRQTVGETDCAAQTLGA